MTFSYIKSDEPVHSRSKPVPAEDVYVVQVMVRELQSYEFWLSGQRVYVGAAPQGSFIFAHYDAQPQGAFHSPFAWIRFSFSGESLQELAKEDGAPTPQLLRRPEYGGTIDPIFFRLARAVLALMESSGEHNQAVLDHIGLAFHARLLGTYDLSHRYPKSRRGGLAHWQERRAKDFIEANLASNLSLVAIAKECGLSTSHFVRAFRTTTGRPPHRYLLERRVAAAKRLLEQPAISIDAAATACGFNDSSHLSRVFSKVAGVPPGAWRKSCRN